MKKYGLIIGGIVIIVGLLGMYILSQTSHSISNGGLSGRAKEFISDQKKSGDDMWQSVNINGQQKIQPQSFNVEKKGCFAFTVPFEMYRDHSQGVCSVNITVDNPRATLTALLDTKGEIKSLSDDSGVMLRREKHDVYQEEDLTENGVRYVSFVSDANGYERDVFYLTPKGVFSMALTANTNENLDVRFTEMLKTLRFE